MTGLLRIMAAFCLLTGGSIATAQSGPVVVELYTSQGCSSCPPADAFLHELTKRDDVIALALHVDYWDYIGWKDEFANPEFSARQRSYARVAGARSVYTPQIIVGGQDHVIGNKPRDVSALVGQHLAKSSPVALSVSQKGGKIQIEAKAASAALGQVLVQVVTYTPREQVTIRRGENAGRTLSYHNIVRNWTTLRKWNGRGTLSITANVPSHDEVVVILQRENYGEILAAAHVK